MTPVGSYDNALAPTLGASAPDNKVHGASMGPTWVLSAPDGPHVGPMNLAIRGGIRVESVVAHGGASCVPVSEPAPVPD